MADDLQALRRDDFWTSLLLLALGISMLVTAGGYPMVESFAGVQNAWYLSPALLPLLIAGALVLFALVLLANSVRSGGARSALVHLGSARRGVSETTVRLLAVVAFIAGYVYGLLPQVDFYLATAVFLLAFVAAFHLDRAWLMKINLAVFATLCATLGVLGSRGMSRGRVDPTGIAVDGAVAAVLVLLVVVAFSRHGGDAALRRRAWTTVAVAVVTPLLLGLAFRYALLVPLPTEGAVAEAFEQLRQLLRGA